MSESQKTAIPGYMKFILGGTAGMSATVCVQPLDLVKTRMQMSGVGDGKPLYRNSFHAIQTIVSNEGVLAVYTGLTAALLRQATYATFRLGIYTSLFEYFAQREGKSPNFLTKLGCAVTAGVAGSFIGTPSEVCLIRMTSDGRLPVHERRNYTNVVNALVRIFREEGLTALWRGAVPTMGRAAVVNGAQLATYSQAKQQILESGYFNDGIGVHFMASMFSGFVTSVCSLPVDIVKTRIQNMKVIDGVPEYKNMGDVLSKIVANEGVFALWKGFTPYFFRLGPHTVLTFIFLEQLNRAYRVLVMGDHGASGGGL